MNELIQRGIAELKSGDRAAAQRWLGAALNHDPSDLKAWLWLSAAVEQDEERFDCLIHMLRLEPDNEVASRGISQLLEKTPNLRPRPARPAPLVASSPQPPARAGVVAALPTAAAETGAEYNSLINRLIHAQARRGENTAGQQAAARADTRPQPAGASQAAVETRVIPVIFPRGPRPTYSGIQTIFRSRPSMVPVIIIFWVMLFSLYVALVIAGKAPFLEWTFPAIMGLAMICILVIVYTLVRMYRTRYELTTQGLSLPQLNQQIEVPLPSIVSIETQQNAFQKLLGTGDIILDASIDGVLINLQVPDIPNVKQRADQIRYLVGDQP